VLHVVAKIDYGCVHGVSLYKYTFRRRAVGSCGDLGFVTTYAEFVLE